VGYDVVQFSGQHTLRAHLVKLFEECQIDAIIDVGANEGQFGLFVRGLGFKGNIYSFEPVSDAFKKLKLITVKDKKWLRFNYALGAQNRESCINVSKVSLFSSILEVNEYALKRWSNSETVKKENIWIKTLNECVAEGMFNCDSHFFLKMDTQGYDLEVFKGATSILPNVQGVLSELSLIHLYEGMPSLTDSLAVFKEAGFNVSGFYPITRNKNLTLNEVDCVLVNNSKYTQ
jgi:FkbM family methyltransferase